MNPTDKIIQADCGCGVNPAGTSDSSGVVTPPALKDDGSTTAVMPATSEKPGILFWVIVAIVGYQILK